MQTKPPLYFIIEEENLPSKIVKIKDTIASVRWNDGSEKIHEDIFDAESFIKAPRGRLVEISECKYKTLLSILFLNTIKPCNQKSKFAYPTT
jgi:hypothetical protein